ITLNAGSRRHPCRRRSGSLWQNDRARAPSESWHQPRHARAATALRSQPRSEVFRGNVERHGIFPAAVREPALAAAVGVHDENLTVLLEGVVVERRLVAEAVDAAVPHDAAIPRPDRMAIARAVRRDAHEIRAIRADGEDVEIDIVDLAREQDA